MSKIAFAIRAKLRAKSAVCRNNSAYAQHQVISFLFSMAYGVTMSTTLGKWITPPEAVSIASKYRVAASEIRLVAQDMIRVSNSLDASWSGNAKNVFDAHFNSFPTELASFADHIDHIATQVANIQVWVSE